MEKAPYYASKSRPFPCSPLSLSCTSMCPRPVGLDWSATATIRAQVEDGMGHHPIPNVGTPSSAASTGMCHGRLGQARACEALDHVVSHRVRCVYEWETKWSVSWFDCDESLTWRGLNLNLGLFYFSFTFVSFRESRLLVSWCAGGRCGIAYSDEDRGRSRRPGAEDRGWSHRSSTR
jgi:hypothetical protein